MALLSVRCFAVFCLLVVFGSPLVAGSGTHPLILRQYPIPGAKEVSTLTSIGITASVPFALPSKSESFIVIGSQSGLHGGLVHLSKDKRTIIFEASTPFDLNELVQVVLSSALSEGTTIRDTFTFTTMRDEQMRYERSATFATHSPLGKMVVDNVEDSIPPPPPPPPPDSMQWAIDWSPAIDNNPTPGRIFIATNTPVPAYNNFLFILDQDGKLLDYHFAPFAFNFELQPNGEMTYYSPTGSWYYGVDSGFNVLDTFAAINGCTTDEHDIEVHSDGSYIVLGRALYTEDLSQVFPDSTGTITVIGNVLQSFDSDKNLVFEWRGIDHYTLSDGLPYYVPAENFDFEHANSIDVDTSGNYLLSNRSFSEITQIDATTGNIVWRFGGPHNQFLLVGDTLGLSGQHDAKWSPSSTLLAFDNGNFHPDAESRAVEFAIDTTDHTATLLWQFHHNPAISSGSMGSVERLPNGNTFIGWGLSVQNAMTEVTPGDTVIFDLKGPTVVSYRALKYPPLVSVSSMSGVAAIETPSGLSLHATQVQDGYELTVNANASSNSSITLSDAAGRIVLHIFDGALMPGEHHISFSTAQLASGAYFCHLHCGEGDTMLPLLVSH